MKEESEYVKELKRSYAVYDKKMNRLNDEYCAVSDLIEENISLLKEARNYNDEGAIEEFMFQIQYLNGEKHMLVEKQTLVLNILQDLKDQIINALKYEYSQNDSENN